MPRCRRCRIEGGLFFLTLVTHRRMAVFDKPRARRLLREAMLCVRRTRPFVMDGIVLLPDHMHVLWRLPKGDADYSTRVSLVKKAFTHAYLAAGGREGSATASRRRHRVRGVWEKRFYEHTIRGYDDFVRHLDYIHSNPVKHDYVASPADWPWSSFHRYVRMDWYAPDWCGSARLPGGVDIEPDQWLPEGDRSR